MLFGFLAAKTDSGKKAAAARATAPDLINVLREVFIEEILIVYYLAIIKALKDIKVRERSKIKINYLLSLTTSHSNAIQYCQHVGI